MGMHARPNILVVIVDDMGVHQLGSAGGGFFETPAIDRLGSEGRRFTCAYGASPVCSPARAALYTGLHPARLHLTNFIPGTEPPNPRLLTPRWRPFLPVGGPSLGALFREAGYATGHFGKWHLAPDYRYEPGRPMDPESQGFDTVVFTRKPLASADPEDDPHHAGRLTDAAIAFMAAPRREPFLCVVAHNALHRPELAPAARVAKFADKPGADGDTRRPVLAAMMEEVDESVGRLLGHLEASGQAARTLVVFTADHGAFGRSCVRKPLRGAKADLYEGGVRVPMIWRWPGKIRAGEEQAPVWGGDLLPTLLELGGLDEPPGLDGRSLAAALRSAPGGVLPGERTLYWHFPHYHHLGLAPSGSIREGRWKLIEWFERTIGGADDGPAYELYDLADDPWESVDLAGREPERCRALAERLRRWRRDVGAQEMTPNPAFCPSDTLRSAPPPPGDPGNPFGE
jgi:arylsulfatase A